MRLHGIVRLVALLLLAVPSLAVAQLTTGAITGMVADQADAAMPGVTITAIVLNLPTAGPLLLRSLVSQDMYLAGSFILLMGVLTLIGMLVSDVLLALLDPRIRFT